MANSTEAQPKSTPDAVDGASSNNKHKTKGPGLSGRSFRKAMGMILLIVAIILALYAIYSSQLSQRKTEHLAQALDNLKQQAVTKASFDSLKQTTDDSQSQVQDLNKKMQSALQQLLYQKQDWLLLRARYYLELAQINAHWSNNQKTTIALLQQADAVLATISEQRLFVVRQAIAKEIAEFNALPELDITGLLSQLDATQNLIADLPFKQSFSNSSEAPEKTNLKNDGWREKLKESMSSLGKLVIVRHNETDIGSLVSPLHQALLRDSIRLNLQETQWSILQNNPQIYQLSLKQALNSIERSFDQHAAATKAVIKQLQALQQQNLSKKKPVLNESLSLLNQWIESKNMQNLNDSAPLEGDTLK